MLPEVCNDQVTTIAFINDMWLSIIEFIQPRLYNKLYFAKANAPKTPSFSHISNLHSHNHCLRGS